MGYGGVAAAGEERLGALAVVINTQGGQTTHGVIELGTGLERLLSAGSFAKACLDVALDGVLVTDAEIEPHGQAVGKIATVAAAGVVVGITVIVVLVSAIAVVGVAAVLGVLASELVTCLLTRGG